jgi:predicted nucleic acid-binding protein
MIVVDTNILLDIANRNPIWLNWSASQMMQLAKIHDLIINPIIYAEFSVTYVLLAEVEKSVSDLGLKVEDLPREAAFLAGKAFNQYRKQGGSKTGVLPDFIIGAHAMVLNCPLLTRDTPRYATYFPTVHLITP